MRLFIVIRLLIFISILSLSIPGCFQASLDSADNGPGSTLPPAEMWTETLDNLGKNAAIMAPLAIVSGGFGSFGAVISNTPGKIAKVNANPQSIGYSYALYDMTDATENIMAHNEGRLEDIANYLYENAGTLDVPQNLVNEAQDLIAGTVLLEGVSNRQELKHQILEAMPQAMDDAKVENMLTMMELNANYRGESLEDYIAEHVRGVVASDYESPGAYFSKRAKEKIKWEDMGRSGALFATEKEKGMPKSERQINDYLHEAYTSEEAEGYFKKVKQFMSRMGRLAREGNSALAVNNKTIMSIDVSTLCPFKEMGSPCIYCYVEQPRTWYEKLGRKLNSNPKATHAFIPYTDEILQMPQEMVSIR